MNYVNKKENNKIIYIKEFLINSSFMINSERYNTTY